MERRTFLYSVPFGLLGFKSLATSMTSPCDSTFEGKVDPFFNLLGAKPASIFFEDTHIESLIKEHASSLLRIGYAMPKGPRIWQKDNKLALTPMTLERKDFGILDVVMLVMRYDHESSIWEYTGTLSGFQIDSLLRIPVSDCIPTSDPGSLEEWLLPSFKNCVQNKELGSYKTNRGKYHTIVNIMGGQTSIDSRLYDGDELIWSEQYISKHSLCKASAYII